jgi:hypothetical protein
MAIVYFNARFIPNGSSQVSTNEFDVAATIFDGIGLFSPADIQVDDIVFLDGAISFSAPGTVNKYKVVQVHSFIGMDVNVRLQWNDVGSPLDPNEISGTAGFISRPSPNRGFAFHASPTLHTIPDHVIQYSRNIDVDQIIDPFYYKLVKNGTLSSMGQYKVVAWNNDGTVSLATASEHNLSDMAGITTKPILPGEFGYVIKLGYVPNALQSLNPLPGATIFLSTVPGEMALVGPTSLTDTIIKIGRAEPPSGVATSDAFDLHIELEILAEP